MNIQCVSGNCRQRLDPKWDFCPYCGTDNRPPAQRRPIHRHTHYFLSEDAFCTICGNEERGPQGFSRGGRIWAARLLLFSGSAILLFVINALLVRMAGVGLFAGWINSWWGNSSIFRVRLPFISTHQLGPTICFWFSVLGIVLVIAGFAIYRKQDLDFDFDLFD